jgi:peptide/nickel transport system ATP-binding protein
MSETAFKDTPLIRAEALTRLFPISRGRFRRATSFIHAVDQVSFSLHRGQSLGLVGESGCGKTTVGKLLVKLLEPTSGRILFAAPSAESGNSDDGPVDIAWIKGSRVKEFRRQAQMIFQDPYESLNPRRVILDTVAEPLKVQGIGLSKERLESVSSLLGQVGLTPAANFLFRYPHELSGGQRQRVAIARALVVGPTYVVADEPTSMLDVSIRAGIMNLMLKLAQTQGVTYLFVTHDLAVARYMCQRIAVMYGGTIVEIGPTEELLQNPQHPYTRALLSAVPVPVPGFRREAVIIKGEMSAAIDPPDRCRFYDRCPLAAEVCRQTPHPPLEEKGPGHQVACHLA